ncbi:hypothetical protein [Mycobacterium riyadhense]
MIGDGGAGGAGGAGNGIDGAGGAGGAGGNTTLIGSGGGRWCGRRLRR